MIHCDDCTACCCQLEVLLLTDTGVPGYLTETDAWGGSVMARLEDGWCAALDRQTQRCSIYDRRPWVCRELEMGGDDCAAIRQAFTEQYALLHLNSSNLDMLQTVQRSQTWPRTA